MGMNYEQEYNRVMGLLQNTKMPHDLCEPRERKACTHCNAVEELDKLIAEYKGARIVLAGAATTTSTQGPFDKRLHERLGAYLNTMVADLGIQGKGEYLRNLFAQFEQEMAVAPPREEVRALVAKWRKEGNASIYSHENRDLNVAGAATLVCADELEAALAATPTQPDEQELRELANYIALRLPENLPLRGDRNEAAEAVLRAIRAYRAATPTLRVQP